MLVRLLVPLVIVTGLGTFPWPSVLFAQAVESRAETPDWSRIDTSAIFFEDAFSAGLVGERPVERAAEGVKSADVSTDTWSKIIAPVALENEVKAETAWLREVAKQRTALAGPAAVSTANRIRHLGFVFGVIARYDAPVRWQNQAAAVARQLSEVAEAVATGNREEVDRASEMLNNLVRGADVWPNDATPTWDVVASRSAAMQRLERSVAETLSGALSDARKFRRGSAVIAHEAAIIAAIAHPVKQPGWEDASDQDYVEHCGDLLLRANELQSLATESSYEEALSALEAVRHSCTECHDMYRG